MAALAQEAPVATKQQPGLTKPQRAQLVRAYLAYREADSDGWVRARNNGERVTLASLYYRHLLLRRVHSGAGTSSPAHEYRIPLPLYNSMHERSVQYRIANGPSSVYRADVTQHQEAPMARTDGTGAVQPDFKGGSGKRSTKGGKNVAAADAAAPEATEAEAAAGNGAAAPKKETKPRAPEKTSKEAKAARKAAAEHKAEYDLYIKAQLARKEANAAGNETGAKKAQKEMDKHRAGYTAKRAADRAYAAAPEK